MLCDAFGWEQRAFFAREAEFLLAYAGAYGPCQQPHKKTDATGAHLLDDQVDG